ncbi:MAG TPA: hypothetical protein VMB73_04995 [Acetobacteraceae bacterium]|jgi:hypothetical protein|nr:hypothetical protein [Acetobacteraceae bacterium]
MNSRPRQRVLTHLLGATCLAAGAMAALLLTAGRPANADEHLSLIAKIDVGGNGLGAFDISYVDPAIGLYTLSDRTNASIDLINAAGDSFIGRVGGFKGVVTVNGAVNNNLSGPDGNVIVDHKEVWAGDGDSTMKVIDIASRSITYTIPTGGQFRVDEMAWDRRDHLVAAANDADTPPFITFFDTKTHAVVGKVTFDGTNGTPNATGGIEQTQWSPETGMLYTSVPQIGPNAADGGVAVTDPKTMKVVAIYPVQNCSPAGLALGPFHQALLGCSASFGTSPNILTQSVVMDITNGNVVKNIKQIGGSDEVWYDRGSNHYYLAARSNETSTGTVMPELGFIDAGINTFDGSVPTSTTAHSVAANAPNRHVFVPIGFVPPGSPAGTDPTNPCPTHGCIAVYVPSGPPDDQLISQLLNHFLKQGGH